MVLVLGMLGLGMPWPQWWRSQVGFQRMDSLGQAPSWHLTSVATRSVIKGNLRLPELSLVSPLAQAALLAAIKSSSICFFFSIFPKSSCCWVDWVSGRSSGPQTVAPCKRGGCCFI